MSDEKIKIIEFGPSPLEPVMAWLIQYENLCRQVAIAYGLPPEYFLPPNPRVQADAKPAFAPEGENH